MFDVIVIGSGPAGSSTAYHAARLGLDVLLIERLPFPRPKVCGDALMPVALKGLARMGLARLPGYRVCGDRTVHLPSLREHRDDYDGGGVVIPRSDLDAIMRDRAMAAGATVALAEARHLVWRNGRVIGAAVIDQKDCRILNARAVVVATGNCAGQLMRGAERRSAPASWGIGGRGYLELARPAGDRLEFYFPLVHEGEWLPGYGWIFPTGPCSANYGVGLVRTRRTRSLSVQALAESFFANIRRIDARFANARGLGDVETAPLPYGPVENLPAGLLPVGDASGLLPPFGREGISNAIETGELAAHALAHGREDAAALYAGLLHDRFPRAFRVRSSSRRLYSHPGFVMGRGWDLLTSPSIVGDGVRRLSWDRQPGRALEDVLTCQLACEAVRHVRKLLESERWPHPLAGELVDDLTRGPNSDFGRYAGFAGAVLDTYRRGTDPSLGAYDGLLVLEMLGIIRALHQDLSAVPTDDDGTPTWGRNALAILVADALNAKALRILCTMQSGRLRIFARAMRSTLRIAALSIADPQAYRASLMNAEAELYKLAAHAVIPAGSGWPAGDAIVRAARFMASKAHILTGDRPDNQNVIVHLLEAARAQIELASEQCEPIDSLAC